MYYLYKTALIPLLVLLCFSSACALTSEGRSRALKDLKNRRPNLEFKNSKKKIRGSELCIKIPYYDSLDFGKKKYYVAIYDEDGNWVYDRVTITRDLKMIPGLKQALIDQGLFDRLSALDQIISKNRIGYSLKLNSLDDDGKVNDVIFLDDKFRWVKYSVAVNNKLLNKSVFNGLVERYGNIKVLDALNYDYGQSFFVTFVYYDNDTRYWARSFYDKKHNWKRTALYFRDYLRLPIELFSFVADQGGIDNFHHIMKEERVGGCEYYKLNQKNKSQIYFNEELQTIDPETCKVVVQ